MELQTSPSKISQVTSQLRNMIKKNNLTAGTRLVGTRQLAEQFKVSPKTVKCALDILCDERLIRCEHGRGIFVEPQSSAGDIEVYVLLWGMRRESCNYFEEVLRMAYPPVLKPGFSFTIRTVFKDSDDFAHFDQELARIENFPQIKCVLAPSVHLNIEHFEKLSQLHCPVVYIGDSKYDDAVDYPRNRVIDVADWTIAVMSMLRRMDAREFTIFIPDGSIAFYKEYTRKLVKAASQEAMKINLVELPCSLYNESDPEKIRNTYQRNVHNALKNGELACPVIIYGMINPIFMELADIKQRLNLTIPFIEPRISSAYMNDFYSATFELIDAVVKAPADLHIKKICNPILIHDFVSGADHLFDGNKEITSI